MCICERFFSLSRSHTNTGNVSVPALYPYFKNLLRSSLNDKRTNQMTKHLLTAQHRQQRYENLFASKAKVTIDHDTICARCKKRIGAIQFARTPEGEITHSFNCKLSN
jgi:hypothetical protein